MYSIDLHTHSHFSDGTLSPTDLVRDALGAGVTELALTDHDCIDGWAEAEHAAQGTSLRLIRGVELSAQWVKPQGSKPNAVHIVGLNITDAAPLSAALIDQQQIRAQRAEQICQKLAAHLKCPDPWSAVVALADGRAEGVTRSHIATWLVQQGRVQRHQQALDAQQQQQHDTLERYRVRAIEQWLSQFDTQSRSMLHLLQQLAKQYWQHSIEQLFATRMAETELLQAQLSELPVQKQARLAVLQSDAKAIEHVLQQLV